MSPRVLDCTEVRSSLPLYSGGDLHPDRQAALDRHLSTCADCRKQAARANSARGALVSGFQRERTGGVDLWPSLRSSLVAEGLIRDPAGRGPAEAPIRRISAYRRWLPVGAAAAAALLAGLWIQRTRSAPNELGPVQITPQNQNVVAIDRPVTPIVPELVVTPVNDTQGLRRVKPGEPRWSETADVFGAQPSPMSQLSPWNPNVGSPVGLRDVRPNQR